MTQRGPHLRSLYRRLLRELPPRQPSILANPSPIQSKIRSQFSHSSPNPPASSEGIVKEQAQIADQIIQYLEAQRTYITLIERYNPGMNMAQDEKVRLSARRIGMELPIEVLMGNKGSGSGSGERGGG